MSQLVRASAALLVALLLPATARADGEKLEPEKADFQKALKKAMPAKPATDGVAGGKLGTTGMRRANEVAAAVLERRLQSNELKLLRQAGEADVIVVTGSYDRVQDVLRAVQVKHVVVPPNLVERLPLMSTQTLMVNCPGNLTRAGVAKVKQFVRTGGYLVTTDWALTLLARAFPGYVARGGRDTGNDVVAVHVHKSDDPWLKHVQTGGQRPRWWLESSSYPIRILDKQRVKVLISSPEMGRKYGHSPIAVAFSFDDGKVLHMTSHFYLQQSKLVSAKERAKGTAFAKAAGLSEKQISELRAKGLDKLSVGELNSAYSMQRVTANVLVSRQAENKTLLQKYGKRARRAVTLSAEASGKGRARGDVGKDYRLRVVEKKGKQVKVRDLFGREGWTDEANLY
jgi:hypothetical protein